MDEHLCSVCNRDISEHSQEEWIECLKIEDQVTLNKIRKHYDKNKDKKN
jgi:hypothetical protein